MFGGLAGVIYVSLLLFGSFWWSLLCSFLWSYWLSVLVLLGDLVGSCWLSAWFIWCVFLFVWCSCCVLLIFLVVFVCPFGSCWLSCWVLLVVLLCAFDCFFVAFVCPFGYLFGSCRCVLLDPVGGLAVSFWWVAVSFECQGAR